MLTNQMNWKFTYEEVAAAPGMSQELSISPLTEQLLVQRGITSIEQAEKFLHPHFSQLYEPARMHDIEKAANRVWSAVEQAEPILIFGDYDADGVSSTTVMLETLRELGAVCDYYIPNRFTEGYGPNKQAFTQAAEQGYKLIVTVDTGIAAIEEAETAKQLGVDLIITDHHEVQAELPDALAIVHPKCSTDYPFQELAGVGVAFKFAQYLLGYFPKHLLDLVALGTVADLVPLKSENRVLVHYGLKAVTTTKRPGLQALKKAANIDGDVSEEHIGFQIGPRLNAVGRLQEADLAVDLLMSQDSHEAEEMAAFIEDLNQERQKVVASIEKEAEEMVETTDGKATANVIIVAKEGWNEGVLGIVASKLVRRFDRPAIVLSINKEKQQAKGSARSIDAFDMFANCMEVRDLFFHFGGHAQAAGMTLAIENVDVLRNALHKAAEEKLDPSDYKQSVMIDSKVELEKLSLEFIEEIGKLAPFGMANPKPLFYLKANPTDIKQIGSQKNHLKFTFKKEGKLIDGIAFGMGDYFSFLSARSEIEFVGELGINEWNGNSKVQMMIRDLAVREWQLFDYRGLRNIKQRLPDFPTEDVVGIVFDKETTLPDVDFSTMVASNVPTDFPKDHLVILDLPERLADLTNLLEKVKPKNIFACYNIKDKATLNSVPSREDFKWFYAMLMKNKHFQVNSDFPKLAKAKSWKEKKIEFISQVFFELDFVKIENGVVTLHNAPSKKDLSESVHYQALSSRLEVEATLYYSSYQELKEWINLQMKKNGTPKEEVSHGL